MRRAHLKTCFRTAVFLLSLGLPLTSVSRQPELHLLARRDPPIQTSLTPCKLPRVEEELLCGKLPVYENRRTRSGRMINLNVVVLPALEQEHKEEPLFDLAGGPGIASTSAAGLYATALREYRRHRDVVLVDQRGTGQSNPLQCPHDDMPQHFVSEMYPVEYIKNCREVLEQRADLTQYTTPIAMDDLDDVRAWLGYDRINLFGLSYGTRAALVYMRQHPEHVRSVVLMSVDPPYQRMPLYHARDGQRALYLLLNECAADQACNNAFPQVRRELMDLLARLKRQPARVSYTVPGTGAEHTVEIQRDVFTEKLRSQLYTPAGGREIPFAIHEAAQGDFAPFLKMAIPANRSAPDFIAEGLYLSVTCAEDVPFIDAAAAARMNAGNLFDNYRVFQQRRACSMWPRGRLPKGYAQPVVSHAAVLIFSGYMDPVTPPEWGEGVARHLLNSKHVIIRHHAHVPIDLSHIECLDKLILEFLSRGSAKELDTSCVEQMMPPPFRFSTRK
jgi:pimeloyl-ACP methyl ester carboxylesterase